MADLLDCDHRTLAAAVVLMAIRDFISSRGRCVECYLFLTGGNSTAVYWLEMAGIEPMQGSMSHVWNRLKDTRAGRLKKGIPRRCATMDDTIVIEEIIVDAPDTSDRLGNMPPVPAEPPPSPTPLERHMNRLARDRQRFLGLKMDPLL